MQNKTPETDAQHAAKYPDVSGWQMDQNGPLPDAFLDMPIPYRMSHEAGLALEHLDPRGDVP